MFAILHHPVRPDLHVRPLAGDQRQGWAIFAAMAGVLVVGAVVAMAGETGGNPLFPAGVDQAARQHGGQGDPLRRRRSAACWPPSRPAPAPGAVNAMHDSFQPIAGLVPLFNMQLGEITPGGVGAGLYGMLILGAILVGVHRRPHGRPHARVPGQEGRGLRDEDGDARRPRAGRQHPRLHGPRDGHGRRARPARCNTGPHGFSEILYAFSSQTGNNGSAFAGLTGNTPFYNIDRRAGDAHRPLRDDHPDPRHRGLDGRQAPRRAVAGHVPHDRRAVRRSCSSAWSSSSAR